MLNRGGGKYYKHLTRLSSLVLFIFAYAIVITGSTYAFMSFSAMSDSVANGQGGCFNVSYTGEELNAGNILSTTNYLEGAHTTVTLSKDSTCKIYTEANIYVHTNNTTTAPIDTIHALKYKLFMEGNQISEGLITQIGDTLIATVPLTDISTTYTIYLWIDPELSNGAYHDTSYSGYIYADSSQTSIIEGKYLVSFDRGNLLYGLEDTNGEVAARGSTTNLNSYIDYSINDDSITVTNNGTQDDGYGLIEPIKINLEKGKTYIFNCDTDGTIGATGNTDTIEIFFGLDGKWITWIRMNSTTNYEFTPTTTGTYWLRLDVNQKGKTHTFSNISITEKESSMFTKTVTAGQEYGWLPLPTREGYTFKGWALNYILPDEYQQVEYVESDGTQYIDTGVKSTSKLSFEAEVVTVDINSAVGTPQILYAGGDGWLNNNYQQVEIQHSRVLFDYGDKFQTKSIDNRAYSINKIRQEKNTLYYNGSEILKFDYSEFSSNYNIYIFAYNRSGTISEYGKYRLYNFKIWEEDKIIRYFIPIQTNTGAIGMYDVINEDLYENRGSGTFKKGPPVEVSNNLIIENYTIVTQTKNHTLTAIWE